MGYTFCHISPNHRTHKNMHPRVATIAFAKNLTITLYSFCLLFSFPGFTTKQKNNKSKAIKQKKKGRNWHCIIPCKVTKVSVTQETIDILFYFIFVSHKPQHRICEGILSLDFISQKTLANNKLPENRCFLSYLLHQTLLFYIRILTHHSIFPGFNKYLT